MSSSAGPSVVVGVDVGTTSVKALAVDRQGQIWSRASAPCALRSPEPGFAVQDWEQLRHATAVAIGHVAARALRQAARINGISIGTAMHGLAGIDSAGSLLTPIITWADTRAWHEAEALASGDISVRRQQRTGTPASAMTPLAKLVWIRTRHPQLFAASRRWVGIKELMLRWLTGRWLVDHSCASGTGLFDLAACDWDREALELAGIDSASLSELVPTTAVVGELTTAAARELAIPAGTRVVSGGGDGPLASLGVGAISPGVAAVSIGTSGALRVTLGRPSVDEMATLFCYALGDNRWTVGGATNNGGAALDWLASVVAPDLNLNRRDELLDEAAAAPPGSEGLLMLPYLLSERTPYWDAQARGAFVGLTYRHNRSHLVRATLEGVCQQLALVLDVVQSAGHTIREVRATGGFSRSALLRQMLADALGQPVSMPAADLGTSLGAAALGMRGLGMIDTLDAVSEWVTIAEVREPDPTASAVLAALRPTFASAYWALRPVFRELTAPAPPVNAWPAA